MLPQTLIIGAQKAGTTSLFRYIIDHPLVLEPVRKEPHFFDANYGNGLDWYRGRFPFRRARPRQTLEASTSYLDNPNVPARVAKDLPDVRLIALLRDPVDRAWSHYRHSLRRGVEQWPFREALCAEEERLAPLLQGMADDESYFPRELSLYSYCRRGRYAEHLERWFEAFGRERLLILVNEELFAGPGRSMEQVWRFLGLPCHY